MGRKLLQSKSSSGKQVLRGQQKNNPQAPRSTSENLPFNPLSSIQPSAILQLQRQVGNRQVQRLLQQNPLLQREIDGPYGTYTEEQIKEQQLQINELTGIDPESIEDKINEETTYMQVAGQKIITYIRDTEQFPETMKTKRGQYEGWKVHVGVKPEQAALLVETVLPLLRKMEVGHKLVDKLVTYMSDPDPHQLGKYITIYPRSITQLAQIVRALEQALAPLELTPLSEKEQSPDYQLGRTGLISTRYGSFTGKEIKKPGGGYTKDDRSKSHPEWKESDFQLIQQMNDVLNGTEEEFQFILENLSKWKSVGDTSQTTEGRRKRIYGKTLENETEGL